jgi:hypothetical protein
MITATKPPAVDTTDAARTDAAACLARLRATLKVLDDCLETEFSPPSPDDAWWVDDEALESRLVTV